MQRAQLCRYEKLISHLERQADEAAHNAIEMLREAKNFTERFEELAQQGKWNEATQFGFRAADARDRATGLE